MNRFGTRLALTYVVLVLLSGLFIGLFLYVGVRDVYIALLSESLARSAKTAASEASSTQSPADLGELTTQVSELTGARVTLIDRNGTVLSDTQVDPAVMDNHAGRPEVRVALAGGTGVDTRLSATTREETLYVAVPAGRDMVARLAVPLAASSAAVTRLRLITVIPILVACGLGAILAYQSALRITRPLCEISEVARAMARGNLSVRTALGGPDEAVELGRALNLMAGNLESHVAQLAATRENLEALLASLPVGVVEVGRGYSVVSANPAAERLLGFGIGAARGRHYAVLLTSPTLSEAIVAALEQGRQGDLEVETSDAADGLLHVNVSPRRAADGKVSGAILVLENLGKIRRDARLRRELVANVSHELKTPVTAIRALSETLSAGAIGDPEAAGRFLDHIGRESERLARLVDDLLELASLEAQESYLEKTSLDLVQPVERAIERLRPMAEKKGQSLTLEVRDRNNLNVLGDEHYLERAVANLVENAVKFSPEGGWIRVSLGKSEPAERPPEATGDGFPGLPPGGTQSRCPEALVEVSDNGPGLPPEAVGRVFERFYRVAIDRSRQSGGTGLGLAIAKHVVQMHGGRVGVLSPGPGLGCRFWFAVPLTPR
jgi:two-component system phosphate regulon sensor histidine kinase PhoR